MKQKNRDIARNKETKHLSEARAHLKSDIIGISPETAKAEYEERTGERGKGEKSRVEKGGGNGEGADEKRERRRGEKRGVENGGGNGEGGDEKRERA